MPLGSKLKTVNIRTIIPATFYAAVGVIFFILLPITNFPPHVGIIGILSLTTAYGLSRKRGWTIWFVVILFFIATTFSSYTLYYFVLEDALLDVSTVTYLVLTWVVTAYLLLKRKTLES